MSKTISSSRVEKVKNLISSFENNLMDIIDIAHHLNPKEQELITRDLEETIKNIQFLIQFLNKYQIKK